VPSKEHEVLAERLQVEGLTLTQFEDQLREEVAKYVVEPYDQIPRIDAPGGSLTGKASAWGSPLIQSVCKKLRYSLSLTNGSDRARMTRKGVPALVDDLQARGRYTFTRSSLAAGADRSEVALKAALRRLEQQGRVASPKRGFYVIVPIEYRSAGSPPASWFIHELMDHLAQPYYVGLLSAAGLHGAAHQQPMVFQVITDRATRGMSAGRVRIEFHVSKLVDDVPIARVQTQTGNMRVATPEVTAFDLVRYPAASGHLSNVATVLAELGEAIDPIELVRLAPLHKVPDVQRLGYLLELVDQLRVAEPLAEWLTQHRHRAVPLRTDWKLGDQPADPRWRVIPNDVVEADL
jgi:predicted transcriptional regulator of viral defense system